MTTIIIIKNSPIQYLLCLFLSCRPTSKELVGECWLQSARVSRKAGHLQTAFNALLNAENTHLAELVSEKAKWLWSKVTPAPQLPPPQHSNTPSNLQAHIN